MTQDEIIELVKQAGLYVATDVNWMPVIGLDYAKNLIELAAAKEREACAKVCDEYAITHGMKGDDNNKAQGWMMMQCGAAIRARGQE